MSDDGSGDDGSGDDGSGDSGDGSGDDGSGVLRLRFLPLCALDNLLSVLVDFAGSEVIVADELRGIDGGATGKPFQAAVAVEGQ